MPISEKLIEELMVSSNFILYAMALFVFYKAMSPIYLSFAKFYHSITHGNKAKLDTYLQTSFQSSSDYFLKSSQKMTAKISHFIDKLYQFNSTALRRRRDYLQAMPFLT